MDVRNPSVPPHNLEAELATLGSLLLSDRAENFDDVFQLLQDEDFYKPAHGKVFRAIRSLQDRSEAIDLITLVGQLRNMGELDKIGGEAFVSSITNNVPSSANIMYYARIVQDAAVRRRLMRASNDILLSAVDFTRDSRALVEDAEAKIFTIANATQSVDIVPLADIITPTIEKIEKMYRNHDGFTGLSSGYEALDSMLSGFQKSEFIILGARPSIGKTALALNIATNIAVHNKIPVGFFSLEMSQSAITERILSSEARVSSDSIRKGMMREKDLFSIIHAAEVAYDAPFIVNATPNIRLLDLRALARRMRQKYSVEIIFIDYISLISLENKDMPRHEQVAEVSRSLKALARELEIPIFALSQVGRNTEGKAPTMADLRESGSLEQDADVILLLHREREKDQEDESQGIETELHIAKQRNGPIGTVKLAFINKYARFENFTEERRNP